MAKQFSFIHFEQALAMAPAEARRMLEEVQAYGESGFEQFAAQRENASASFFYKYSVGNLQRAIDIFDRAEAKPKNYEISYIIKANRHQTAHCMTVYAGNVSDAKTIVKYAVQRNTGHNAFTVTSGKLPKGWDWDVIAERDCVTVADIIRQAKEGGYMFA